MTREEHLAWCKARALEYIERGDVRNGITSMMSDLSKHPETKALATSDMESFQAMIATMLDNDARAARRFIESIN